MKVTFERWDQARIDQMTEQLKARPDYHQSDEQPFYPPIRSPWSYIREADRNITLWLRYERVYHRLRKNPRAREALKNDPGVKFMRAGWRIFWIVVLLLFVIYLNK